MYLGTSVVSEDIFVYYTQEISYLESKLFTELQKEEIKEIVCCKRALVVTELNIPERLTYAPATTTPKSQNM